MTATERATVKVEALLGPTPPAQRRLRSPVAWWRDPWRKPRILATVTWAYLIWALLPVAIAIQFSFNKGRSRSTWQGFSMQWWTGSKSVFNLPIYTDAIRHSLLLAVLAVIITVPLVGSAL